MTKQEEIREEIAKELYVARSLMGDMPWSQARGGSTVMADLAYAKADRLLSYLRSRGVVIKVDRELPKHLFAMWCRGSDRIFEEYAFQDSITNAGYMAVEPLIKEGK